MDADILIEYVLNLSLHLRYIHFENQLNDAYTHLWSKYGRYQKYKQLKRLEPEYQRIVAE